MKRARILGITQSELRLSITQPLKDMANSFYAYYTQLLEDNAKTFVTVLESIVGTYYLSSNPVNIIKNVAVHELQSLKDRITEDVISEDLNQESLIQTAIEICEKTDTAMLRTAAISENQMHALVRSNGVHVQYYVPAFEPYYVINEHREKIRSVIQGASQQDLMARMQSSFELEFQDIVAEFKEQICSAVDILDAQLAETEDNDGLFNAWSNFKKFEIKFAHDLAEKTLIRLLSMPPGDAATETERIAHFQRKFETELTKLNESGKTIINQIIEYSYVSAKRVRYAVYDAEGPHSTEEPRNNSWFWVKMRKLKFSKNKMFLLP